MQIVAPRVKAMGIKYFDWNVDDGDSKGIPISAQQVVNNVISQSVKHDNPVILCHDIKKSTVEAVPQIIRELKARGYSFTTLSTLAPTCQSKAR